MDAWAGKHIDDLKKAGLYEDTIILFWSDHGEMAGDYGWLHKSNFHESALLTPTLVRWPGPLSRSCVVLPPTIWGLIF